MSIMAFIPARGGSKGIPRKNLALLNGSPLIKYTIDAAKRSKYLSEIFLSSEDEEIIEFSKSLGVAVSYRRPERLARDDSSMLDVVLHGLEWLRDQRGHLPTGVMLLQPTSPLRTERDIDGAIELFMETNADSLMSVHMMTEHPYECIRTGKDSWTYLAKSPIEVHRRQDYHEKFYFINGAIYLVKTDYILKERKFVCENDTELYYMQPTNGLDVDDPVGLKAAEYQIKMNVG